MDTEAIQAHAMECEKAKVGLPEGAWLHEPHRVNWRKHGLDCMILRNPATFGWCGYVGVPPTHPAYRKKYDDVDVGVHGGLTYADECSGHICHIADEAADKTWWLGFDCAHGGDFLPKNAQLRQELLKQFSQLFSGPDLHEHYWTCDEAARETESLAKQLSEMRSTMLLLEERSK